MRNMDRREFINKGAGAVVAVGLGGTVMPAFAGVTRPSLHNGQDINYKPEDGIKGPLKLRFLGTGAADWKGTRMRIARI